MSPETKGTPCSRSPPTDLFSWFPPLKSLSGSCPHTHSHTLWWLSPPTRTHAVTAHRAQGGGLPRLSGQRVFSGTPPRPAAPHSPEQDQTQGLQRNIRQPLEILAHLAPRQPHSCCWKSNLGRSRRSRLSLCQSPGRKKITNLTKSLGGASPRARPVHGQGPSPMLAKPAPWTGAQGTGGETW